MHYMVAYGHVIHHAQEITAEQAMRSTFGIVDPREITLCLLPKAPHNMARRDLQEVERKLAVRHFHRTGSIVSGYGKEPGIHNIHWTRCLLCQIPITTQPAESGSDQDLCQSCQAKYDTLTEQEQEDLSIVQMRAKLAISIHSSPAFV